MKKYLVTAMLLYSALASTPSAAQSNDTTIIPTFRDGNELYRLCASQFETEKVNCLGYIQGAADSLEAARLVARMLPCIKEPVELGQIQDVVILYLRDHPEIRHRGAAGLIWAAIADAWHCRSN